MFLHPTTVYGPVHSRRLGPSLGINLLPGKRKVCNFECIYCECGWTDTAIKDNLPTASEFEAACENKLKSMRESGEALNYISFAGNGEPTLHPEFDTVIEITLKLRQQYYPKARIAVFSNATRLNLSNVFDALKKIDDRILKLDAGTEKMFRLIDMPDNGITLDSITKNLSQLNGDVTIQSMFLRGEFRGHFIDNTTGHETDAWIERLKIIHPKMVMLYSLDRQPPAENLEKISKTELESIVKKVNEAGIPAEAF
ncbi:radical SAM protein [bacterium]|nr:radical SAM protein [bacterium]